MIAARWGQAAPCTGPSRCRPCIMHAGSRLTPGTSLGWQRNSGACKHLEDVDEVVVGEEAPRGAGDGCHQHIQDLVQHALVAGRVGRLKLALRHAVGHGLDGLGSVHGAGGACGMRVSGGGRNMGAAPKVCSGCTQTSAPGCLGVGAPHGHRSAAGQSGATPCCPGAAAATHRGCLG